MERDFDQFLEDTSYPTRRTSNVKEFWVPPLDIEEKEKELCILAEIPGIKKEDIHIELQDGNLIISGERILKKEKNEKHLRVERQYGKFRRSLPISKELKENQIKAVFTNGLLEISIPKPEESKEPKTKKIKIH